MAPKISGYKYATIHHSAVSPGAKNLAELKVRAASYDRTHGARAQANGWDLKTDGKYGYSWISYHYMIASNGEVLQTQDIKYLRYHATDLARGATSHNLHGIAICFDGNFENEKPTENSLKAAGQLIHDLEKKLGVTLTVLGHKHTALSPTACPGKNLDAVVKSKIVAYANNPEPIVPPKPTNTVLHNWLVKYRPDVIKWGGNELDWWTRYGPKEVPKMYDKLVTQIATLKKEHASKIVEIEKRHLEELKAERERTAMATKKYADLKIEYEKLKNKECPEVDVPSIKDMFFEWLDKIFGRKTET